MANKIKLDTLLVENARRRKIDVTDNMTVQDLKERLLQGMPGMPQTWDGGHEIEYYKCVLISELDQTIRLRPGETLIMVPADRHRVRPLVLRAHTANGRAGEYRIDYRDHPALIGRSDNDFKPAVDLSKLLGAQDRSISRRQMELKFMDGEWTAYKHRDARVPVFVNNSLLAEDTPARLQHGMEIAIGSSADNALVVLTVRFEE